MNATQENTELFRKLQSALTEDKVLYGTFVASIESVIYDDGTVCDISDQHNLAVEIANRIIGGNNDKV